MTAAASKPAQPADLPRGLRRPAQSGRAPWPFPTTLLDYSVQPPGARPGPRHPARAAAAAELEPGLF